MDSIRSLLLPVDSSPQCATRMNLAKLLAEQWAANCERQCKVVLNALFAETPPMMDLPYSHVGAAAQIEELYDLHIQQRNTAKATYDRMMRNVTFDVSWSEVEPTGIVPA